MMSIRGKGIRAVAFFLVVILAGYFCLSAWAPATDAENGKADTSTGVNSASSEEDTPGVQEQEAPAKVKKKHFPWIWVVAGVVVAGVIIYFTVIKKPKYKLNVIVGPGVSGFPANGTTFYKKGKRVDYSYQLEATYKNLRVYLDGVAVPASGQIKIDRHHTVAAYADESYFDLTVTTTAGVSGTPAAGTYTHREGTSVAYHYELKANYINLKVLLGENEVPASGTILIDKSQVLVARAEMEPISPPPEEGLSGTWELIMTSSSGVIDRRLVEFELWCGYYYKFSVIVVPPYISTPRGELSGSSINFRVYSGFKETTNWIGTFYLGADEMSGTYKRQYEPETGGAQVLESGTWTARRIN